MRFELGRMRSAMRRLGDPQNSFLSVHVAGTNGKGSVAAMLSAVLRRSGYRVGMYTSPHLERMNERFQLNGRPIPAADLRQIVDLLEIHWARFVLRSSSF